MNNIDDMDGEIMTIDECAEMLKKSRRTIRKYMADGSIPFSKKNGSIYFFRSEILKWLKNGE